MGKQYKAPYWVVNCEKHGRFNDDNKTSEVVVEQPKSRREIRRGCPACAKQKLSYSK